MRAILCPIVALVFGASSALAQAPALATARDSALHALSRLAYGPRPGEIDSVARIGVVRWIEAQVKASLPEPELENAERQFDLLRISPAELARKAVISFTSDSM